MKFYFHSFLFLLVSTFIASCDSSNNPQDQFDVILPDISTAPLKKVESDSEMEAYLKNGLKLTNNMANNGIEFLDGAPSAEITTASNDSSYANFSSTNIQEAGVDEADKIEYDGEFLYVLTHSDYYWYDDLITFGAELALDTSIDASPVSLTSSVLPPTTLSSADSPSGVRVMQRGENASMNEIAWLEIDNQNGFDGLYLAGDVLAALSLTYGSVQTLEMNKDTWYWGRPQTRLDLMDVSTPASINTTHTIVLDGHLVSSRRVENTLVLITQYTPDLPGFMPYSVTEAELINNQDILNDITLHDLLPKKSVNGEVSPLLLATDCYVPQNLPENAGYANLTIVSVINLLAPDEVNSSCFNAVSHGIYASTQSLYVTASDDNDETIIHKFSIETPHPLYLASGSVPGNLGWANPAYRMSESGDHLRVISTQRNELWQPEHFLTILQDNKQGALQQVSQLPNESQPEKIGKPLEDIQSVRFFQNRAYIVTFRQIDPLYVVDVSDAAAPEILGELEIPGFSSYLHPVNDHYLLGFGQQSWADSKMSLFDVSNPQSPIEIKNFIWKNTATPLRWDPHAFAIIESQPNHFRFTFPVESWVDATSSSGLYLFDLSFEDGSVELNEPLLLPISTDNVWGYAYGYNQRSVIHQDEVHYVYDHRVWSASWDLSIINPAQ